MSEISNLPEAELQKLERTVIRFRGLPQPELRKKVEALTESVANRNNLHELDVRELFSYLFATAVVGF